MQRIKRVILIAIFSFILSTPSFAQLSGSYTVGGNSDLQTINDAVDLLLQEGVSGEDTVTFNILPGTYTEQIRIPPITGATASAPVVFRANSDGVIIQYEASSPEDNWIVLLVSASNVIFENILFDAQGERYCRAFYIIISSNITIQGCLIMGALTTLPVAGLELVYVEPQSEALETSNLSILSNDFYYGNIGVQIASNFASPPVNNIVRDNRFFTQYHSAITMINQSAPILDKNEIFSASEDVSYNAFDIRGWQDGLQITGNQVLSLRGTGISVTNGTGQSENHGLVANNFIRIGNGTQGTSVGAYLSNNKQLDFYHNSIYVNNLESSFASRALWIPSPNVQSNSTNVLNNILASPTGYVFYVADLRNIGNCNYNVFDATGSDNFIFWNGQAYSDLQSLVQVTRTRNATSVQTSVVFKDVGGGDLHLAGASLFDSDLLGTSVGITTDIDGDLRNTSKPQVGADEVSVALPVELVSFAADVAENAVTLSWQTATETGNFGFEVERSSDAEHWQKIAFVPGAGTIVEVRQYKFADYDIKVGTYYYRLRQVDTDGSFDYSGEIKVTVGGPQQFALAQNYPNPFNPTTVIEYTLPEAANVELSIVNVRGELVRQLVADNMTAGSYHISWNGRDENGNNVASGSYFYLLKADGKTLAIKKMLLLR